MNKTKVNSFLPKVEVSKEKLEEAIRRLNRMDVENKSLIAEMQNARRLAGKNEYNLRDRGL